MNMNRSWMVHALAFGSLLMPLGCLGFDPGGDDDDDDGEGGDYASGGSNGAGNGNGAGDPGGGGSCDPSVFVDLTYYTPDGVYVDGDLVFYQVRLASDGTFQREIMIASGGGGSVYCNHGTWLMPECGTVALESACDGSTLQQTLSSDGSTMVLEGIEMVYYEAGTFLCGPTEC